ncbi:hypothetical protein K488DRAFT_73540 [Vararia minispora EC-137]|uniref:Uncharacterized protein n=1 Tax=Vararia minispora EC-137 TaxID=1314806 RepID=A0ACB8QAR3_9AGAM|nr:hypothetical protein K488DRAFT_73540 [Vararia minispora EC-137]
MTAASRRYWKILIERGNFLIFVGLILEVFEEDYLSVHRIRVEGARHVTIIRRSWAAEFQNANVYEDKKLGDMAKTGWSSPAFLDVEHLPAGASWTCSVPRRQAYGSMTLESCRQRQAQTEPRELRIAICASNKPKTASNWRSRRKKQFRDHEEADTPVQGLSSAGF